MFSGCTMSRFRHVHNINDIVSVSGDVRLASFCIADTNVLPVPRALCPSSPLSSLLLVTGSSAGLSLALSTPPSPPPPTLLTSACDLRFCWPVGGVVPHRGLTNQIHMSTHGCCWILMSAPDNEVEWLAHDLTDHMLSHATWAGVVPALAALAGHIHPHSRASLQPRSTHMAHVGKLVVPKGITHFFCLIRSANVCTIMVCC